METRTSKQLVQQLLEEEALAIGGLLAVHEVDDEFVWQLFQSLDSIGEKYLAIPGADALNGLSKSFDTPRKAQPHPAVAEFLARIRRA